MSVSSQHHKLFPFPIGLQLLFEIVIINSFLSLKHSHLEETDLPATLQEFPQSCVWATTIQASGEHSSCLCLHHVV